MKEYHAGKCVVFQQLEQIYNDRLQRSLGEHLSFPIVAAWRLEKKNPMNRGVGRWVDHFTVGWINNE